MNDLKKAISNKTKKFVDEILDEADAAEKDERYFNKSIIGRHLNELYNGIDTEFINFTERMQGKKKRW